MPIVRYSIDWWLNWLIPTVIILIMVGVVYIKFKRPIDTVIGWVKSLFGAIGETAGEGQERVEEITYGS